MTVAVPTPNVLLAAAQTPQRLTPIAQVAAPIDLDEIQGDILIGLQKNAQRLAFFAITDVAGFKVALREIIASKVTYCTGAHDRERELSDNKIARVKASISNDPAVAGSMEPLIDMCGFNVAFTIQGLRKLLPNGVANLPPAFVRNGADTARTCGDPLNAMGMPASWDPSFPHDGIDGVFNFAGSSRTTVDENWLALKDELAGVVVEVWPDGAVGDVRPRPFRGHEHFGWLDGVSQPAVKGLAVPYPGQAEVDAGAFAIGAPGGAAPVAGLEWIRNGSFMVFRKLEQDVQGFHTFVASEACAMPPCRPAFARCRSDACRQFRQYR